MNDQGQNVSPEFSCPCLPVQPPEANPSSSFSRETNESEGADSFVNDSKRVLFSARVDETLFPDRHFTDRMAGFDDRSKQAAELASSTSVSGYTATSAVPIVFATKLFSLWIKEKCLSGWSRSQQARGVEKGGKPMLP